MIEVRKQRITLYVDRTCQQWVALDPDGNFWILPCVENLIARVMHLFATTTPAQLLELGKRAGLVETESAWSGTLAGAVPVQTR